MEKNKPRPEMLSESSVPLEAHDAQGEEFGLSLEELGQTYAQLLGQGSVPYRSDESERESPSPEEAHVFDPLAEELRESDQCPVTPLSILESILFVGQPDNAGIEAESVAALMRGVRAAEIEQLIEELNALYSKEGHVMRIVSSGQGYRMQLAEPFTAVCERFYGTVREIKLTQAAIDCLAIIAYRSGITREELDTQRGQPSGPILNQLVRRQLVEVRLEGGKNNRVRRYYATQRLLELAGIESLEELPLAEDFER